jgi:uncharacterized protein with von Willebrand factor type A (vWA) domain
MTTKTTDLQWEIQAYGMAKAELNRMVKTQAFPGQELMFAAGMLSDAQEVLAPEWNPDGVEAHNANRARQMINCAKAIVFDLMDKKETA